MLFQLRLGHCSVVPERRVSRVEHDRFGVQVDRLGELFACQSVFRPFPLDDASRLTRKGLVRLPLELGSLGLVLLGDNLVQADLFLQLSIARHWVQRTVDQAPRENIRDKPANDLAESIGEGKGVSSSSREALDELLVLADD